MPTIRVTPLPGGLTYEEKVELMTLDEGAAPEARFYMDTVPTAGYLVIIGGDTYEFDGTGTNINVVIGTLAVCRNNLETAINEEGTALVVADQPVGSSAGRIRRAADPGGATVIGPTALALSAAMTAVTNVWNTTNLNNSGAARKLHAAYGKLIVDANMLVFDASGTFEQELPFAPSTVTWRAFDSTGAEKATTALVEIAGAVISFLTAEGASPLVATDYVLWEAYGE